MLIHVHKSEICKFQLDIRHCNENFVQQNIIYLTLKFRVIFMYIKSSAHFRIPLKCRASSFSTFLKKFLTKIKIDLNLQRKKKSECKERLSTSNDRTVYSLKIQEMSLKKDSFFKY